MAKIGLDNFLYGLLTESASGTAIYGTSHKPGKAISCNVSISNNSATLYADNVLAESDTSFQSGTVTLGLDDNDLETQAALLGHTVTDGVIERKASDAAPYVGFGRVVTKIVNGVKKYKVEFLHKVKFAEPSQEDTTKGENIEFGTVTIEGQVMALPDGRWGTAKTFDSREDANAYVESFFTTTVYTVKFNANQGTGEIADMTCNRGSSIILPGSTGMEPPTGKTTMLGWAFYGKPGEYMAPGSSYAPDHNVILYAVWQ